MKTIVAAALGECVHVAGIMNFLRLAEQSGWRTVFLGPAVSIEQVLKSAREENADVVGISYRLTPETGERLVSEFAEAADDLRNAGVRFLFAGTPPLAQRIRQIGFFDRVYEGGESPESILAYLQGKVTGPESEAMFPQTVVERIRLKAPFPILRHHFGLPTIPDTLAGIKEIAEAGVLDVISLGIDQDAQENFFHPERQNPRQTGAGGVPVRSAEDYRALYQASRYGNFPLLRVYSGTDDFIRLAEMYQETIHNAWGAVPLYWFNQLDGRGPWDLQGSIEQHQQLIRWYGEHGIPLELNEPHHWGMRDAPDVVSVVSAYLSAYNARTLGVRDYIAQMMFNSPPGLSDVMDLAKMAAILEIIEPLTGPDFTIWRQVRTGLLSYPLDLDAARSHLATSVYIQMALQPHIVHIVGHTEAQHAATGKDVIEACVIVRKSIERALYGQPAMLLDERLKERKNELIREASVTLEAIRRLAQGSDTDPFTDAGNLTRAAACGIMDAPHLRGSRFAPGNVHTIIDARGACVAVDPVTHALLDEKQRIEPLLQQFRHKK
ncbi:MAG: cobalamin B12-binding domain-containing protein [Chloroflexi bacterium]|nr:cobalamin B12-binding domain-containing protein [Chloroflexota bacterium]